MTSRERLLKCLKQEPTDRVPISTYELVGWNFDSWENNQPDYARLMESIRQQTDCIFMMDPTLIEAPDTATETREWRFGNSAFTEITRHSRLGDLTQRYRVDDGIHTTWTLKHLLEDISDIDKYLSLPYSPPQVDLAGFYHQQSALGDKGVMMISVADPVCVAAELFEMGTFLVHAITETEKIQYLLDAIHDRQMETLRNILRHDVKDVIFRICGPEYATPPYLPTGYFPQFVTKYLIRMCSEIRQAGGIPRIHSHGKIAKVIDQFAMTDAMAIDPLEPLPDGDMPLAEVKKKYGSRFCLFGNIELKELEFASTDRVDQLVKSAMSDAKSGGGFVLMPTAAPINNDLSKVTERNYLQYIESALKYGQYE